MAQVTFTDKDNTLALDHPNRLLTDDNVNEIKNVINTNQNAVSAVDNTPDSSKPVSTAQAAAIAVVQNDINSHEANTSNPHGVTKTQVGLGSATNTSDADKPVSTAQAAAIAVVQNDVNAHEALTNNPHGVTKAQVGLSNADNTADTAKPVSTAQQTALDLKQPLDSDLTFISGLSPINDDFLQKKAGQWTNRTIAQVQADLGITLLTSFVDSEVPAGAVNSSNVTFTLANTPIAGSVKLYQNGIRLKLTADYTISGLTITFVTAPTTGDLLLADYRK